MVVLTNNELETIVVLTHETHEPSHLDGDEMPHMQQCLKDVALEEVEDVHAYDYDENDNEMEICNLVDTKIVKESGREMGEGGGVHSRHWGAPGAQVGSQTPCHSSPHSTSVHAYEVGATLAPRPCIFYSPPPPHAPNVVEEVYHRKYEEDEFLGFLDQCMNLFNLSITPPPLSTTCTSKTKVPSD